MPSISSLSNVAIIEKRPVPEFNPNTRYLKDAGDRRTRENVDKFARRVVTELRGDRSQAVQAQVEQAKILLKALQADPGSVLATVKDNGELTSAVVYQVRGREVQLPAYLTTDGVGELQLLQHIWDKTGASKMSLPAMVLNPDASNYGARTSGKRDKFGQETFVWTQRPGSPR